MKKAITILLCLALLSTLLYGCGGGKLSGRWEYEKDSYSSKDAYRYLPASLELFSNGSGTANIPYYGTEDITWTSESGRLKIKCGIAYSFTYDYEISGSKMVLTYQNYSVVLVKKELKTGNVRTFFTDPSLEHAIQFSPHIFPVHSVYPKGYAKNIGQRIFLRCPIF